MRCAAYFFETIFGRGQDEASLESPFFSAVSNTCVYFHYWISSPKIQLRISGRTSADAEFVPSGTVLFADQQVIDSWSDAVVGLDDGVIQFQIIADKTGVSNNIHHVLVDNVHLDLCPEDGNSAIIGPHRRH